AGFYSNKTWFAAKTGTTDNGGGRAKDSWLLSYSPVLATAIWNGNHDGRALSSGNHNVAFRISANYVDRVHAEVYGADGKWKSGDRIHEPAGMQHMSVNGKNDIWPSWYNKSKSSGITNEKMVFDSISKKKATDCTPEETRIEVEVSKMIDPMTGKEVYYAGGYDTENEDDVHQCGDAKPSILSISWDEDRSSIIVKIKNGRYSLQNYTVTVDGQNYNGELPANGKDVEIPLSSKPTSVSAHATDTGGYSTSANWSE
ncbi:hypothetical protein IKG50_03280, partial [Candidatus Saccharibacteria bacterium]|nr:hypothetical protein [Candidatus Saccharibacteria bacterium]